MTAAADRQFHQFARNTMKSLIQGIREKGPRRVVVNESGEALSPARAEKLGIKPDIIFVRTGDGWSLGAPKGLELIAWATWSDVWEIAFTARGELRWTRTVTRDAVAKLVWGDQQTERCCRCGERKPCRMRTDPFISEAVYEGKDIARHAIYSGDTTESPWCDDCFEEREDEV